MELCGLPKARPITCSDCPAFQRLHSSVRCVAESATRFPWVIHTTFVQKFYIRRCCADPLRPPGLSETGRATTQTCDAAVSGMRAKLGMTRAMPGYDNFQ